MPVHSCYKQIYFQVVHEKAYVLKKRHLFHRSPRPAAGAESCTAAGMASANTACCGSLSNLLAKSRLDHNHSENTQDGASLFYCLEQAALLNGFRGFPPWSGKQEVLLEKATSFVWQACICPMCVQDAD